MKSALLIVGSAVFFSLLGLGAAYIAIDSFSSGVPGGFNDIDRALAVFLPPAFGAVFGLIVGTVAVVLGNKVTPSACGKSTKTITATTSDESF
jgi:hypothetical protein